MNNARNNFKASTQNFDSSYIYAVEERDESEKIIRQSDRGLLSIENNELPKVTRYFLKDNKGEPQGYIERKFIQNYKTKTSDGEELNAQIMRKEKIISEHPLPKENQKSKIDSHTIAKGGKKVCSYKANPKSLRRCSNRSHMKNNINCISLNSSVFGQSKNFTLDFTSSNSTPSDRTYDIKHTANTVDTITQKNIELKPGKEKVFSQKSTMKAQRFFCKDPNKRLKNLFTIVKPPNENLSENATVPKCLDANLLNKTKKLLVKLIDQELQRLNPANKNVGNQKLDNVIEKSVLKKLKLDCIRTIEGELRLMKRLQNC